MLSLDSIAMNQSWIRYVGGFLGLASMFGTQVLAYLPPQTFDFQNQAANDVVDYRFGSAYAGWNLVDGSAVVAPAGEAGFSTKSLKLSPQQGGTDTHLYRDVDWNASENVAFIDFRIQPPANPGGSSSTIYANGSQIAFQKSLDGLTGQIWMYHGNDGDNTRAEQWILAASNFPLNANKTAASQPLRFTLRQDYAMGVWDLFVDGVMVAANLDFDGRVGKIRTVHFYGSDVSNVYLDDITADPVNMLFTDTDKDGMPNSWETQNGSNPNLNDRSAINNLTGRSRIEDYLAGIWNNSHTSGGTNGSLSMFAASSPPAPGTIAPLSALQKHVPIGSLKGSLNVGGDGSATYSVPIDLPKGTAGMEPKLSLDYSSNGTNGVAGLGWALTGLQQITRGPASLSKDTMADPVDFDSNDRFFFNGERLVLVGGTYGAPGSEYRTEIDSFARIVANGSQGSGPASWTVQTKSGLVLTLGGSADSKVGDSRGVLSWSVNRVADTLGNYYQVQYASDPARPEFPGEIRNQRVASVAYTGLEFPTKPSMAPYSTIEFDFETRADIRTFVTAGIRQTFDKRLKTIRVKTGTFENHRYELTYQNSFQTGRSLLKAIQKKVAGQSIPATEFDYDGLQEGQPLWVNQGGNSFPTYGSNWDATGSVNSLVTVTDGGTGVELSGDVSRVYQLPSPVTLHSDSVLQFEFKSSALATGAMIGLDTDATYQWLPQRLVQIGGPSQISLIPRQRIPYTNGSGWQTFTINVGSFATGVHSHLVLMCVDENFANGSDHAHFRNIKVFRTGTQTAASVSPISFGGQFGMLRLADAYAKGMGTSFIDLNDDGLVDIADWRATNYTGTGTAYGPVTSGTAYRNTGFGFVEDTSLLPPASIPLGCREWDAGAYHPSKAHHLLGRPMDINANGKLDLMAPVAMNLTGGSLTNTWGFFERGPSGWQEMTAWRLPFTIKNLGSTAPYGGVPRDHHMEWVDINLDGWNDLAIHLTSYGQIFNTAGQLVADGDTATPAPASVVYLNTGHTQPGWQLSTSLGLPEPLALTWPNMVSKGRQLTDMNGDGYLDISESISGGYWETRNTYFYHPDQGGWNTVQGAGTAPPSPFNLPASTTNNALNVALANAAGDPMDSMVMDINGDGLPDAVKSIFSANVHVSSVHLNRGVSPGGVWVQQAAPSGSIPQDQTYAMPKPLFAAFQTSVWGLGFEWLDLNGDGLTDLVYSDDSAPASNLTYLNTGRGWNGRAAWGLPGSNRIYVNYIQAQNGQKQSIFQDLNGDGFPDLITGVVNAIPQVWINQCRPEVLVSVTDGFDKTLEVEYARLNDPTPRGLDAKPAYSAYSPSFHSELEAPLPDHVPAIGGGLVVTRLVEPDGIGGCKSTRRYYGDLRYDRKNQVSLGFGWIEVHDEQHPFCGQVICRGFSRTIFKRSFPFSGSPKLVETFTKLPSNLSPISTPHYVGVTGGILRKVGEEFHTYGEILSGIQDIEAGTVDVWHPIQIKSVSKTYDIDDKFEAHGTLLTEVTTEQTSFDSYGFLLKSSVKALDGSETKTENTYAHFTSGQWLLGRLMSSNVTKSDPDLNSVTKTTNFAYDTSSGLLTSEVVEPDNALSLLTVYAHDSRGNVTETKTTGSGQTRTTSQGYDPNGRFVVSETNPLGTVHHAYDLQRALLISTTDINGRVTSYEYDSFGTQLAVHYPNGTSAADITRYAEPSELPSEVATILSAAGTQVVWARVSQKSGQPEAVVYFDSMGREVATRTRVMTSAAPTFVNQYQFKIYDSRGRVTAESAPFRAGDPFHLTQRFYDFLDREVQTIAPDGAVTKITEVSREMDVQTIDPDGAGTEITEVSCEMDGANRPMVKITTANPKGVLLTRYTDQHGRTVKSQDASGQITVFKHDVEGRTIEVTIDNDVQLTNTYDIFGNRVAMSDLSSGSSSSTYNAFGELLSTTNAENQTISTTYDHLGRVVTVSNSEGTYTTQYRTTTPNIGLVSQVTGPSGYLETYTYGVDTHNYGLVTSSTTQFDSNDTPRTVQTIYGPLGLPVRETDAGGVVVDHDYAGGSMGSFKLRSRLIFAPGLGNVNLELSSAPTIATVGSNIQTTESLPHGITRNSLIDAASGRIVQIVSTRGSQTLQSLSYEWDINGNLTKRTDHTKSAPNNAEVFTYDNLDRLVSSKVGNQSTVTYDYDAKGNLTNTTGGSSSATRSYPTNSYKVSNATIKGVNRSYTYDEAGFVISMDVDNVTAGDTTFQWTSFGQLREIQKTSAPPLMTLPQSSFSDPAFAGIPRCLASMRVAIGRGSSWSGPLPMATGRW